MLGYPQWPEEKRSKCENGKWKVKLKLFVHLHNYLEKLYIIDDKSDVVQTTEACRLSVEKMLL